MRLNPVPEVKKGFCFFGLFVAWMIYMFFDPFSVLVTGAFLTAILVLAFKKFY
jgi:hypothetical protein